MSDQHFKVVPYSHQSLMKLLTADANTAPESLENRIHGVYFKEYFEYLGTKTIVAENQYVDQHFLEDFAAYYVNCFQQYKSICRRLHFFSTSFSEADFRNLINNETSGARNLSKKTLQKSYLGFVVVKPLPSTLIGRTCLKTYLGKNRHYPITKTYNANLFGIPLSVESIAFQEQDTVTAACATSALWSAFHCTGKTFHHFIPSPNVITAEAKKGSLSFKRVFPNAGLTVAEMAQAIRAVGLEPLVFGGAENPDLLSSTIYGYLNAKIPVILSLEIFENSGKSVGWHGITVTGYRLGRKRTQTDGDKHIRLMSDRIDKIYAHDDQVGPFSRLELLRGFKEKVPFCLSSSYGGVGTHYAIPDLMLVPVDKNIRIPFGTISNSITEFDFMLKGINSSELTKIEWNIFLSSINDLKTEIFNSKRNSIINRNSILVGNLPKFVWRARASVSNKPVFELLFDSTDIEQGKLLLSCIEYSANISQEIRSYSKLLLCNSQIENLLRGSTLHSIFEYFKKDD